MFLYRHIQRPQSSWLLLFSELVKAYTAQGAADCQESTSPVYYTAQSAKNPSKGRGGKEGDRQSIVVISVLFVAPLPPPPFIPTATDGGSSDQSSFGVGVVAIQNLRDMSVGGRGERTNQITAISAKEESCSNQ